MRSHGRFVVTALFAVLVVAATAAPIQAAEVNLNFYPLSGRSLDGDFWAPVEDQAAFGGTVDFGAQGSPLHFAVGLHVSVGEEEFGSFDDNVTGVVSETSFGASKVWGKKGRTRVFLSGGVSVVWAGMDVDDFFFGSVDDDDDSIGYWAETGIYWRLGTNFGLGFYGRILEGTDITLFGVEGDANYWQAGPALVWSWPAR